MITFKQYANVKLNEYREEKGGTFTHDGQEYDLNALFKLTAREPLAFFKVKDLKWILPHTDIDSERMVKADISAPILVTEYKNKWVVVDGAHRLARAVNDKIEELPGRVVSAEQLESIKT